MIGPGACFRTDRVTCDLAGCACSHMLLAQQRGGGTGSALKPRIKSFEGLRRDNTS